MTRIENIHERAFHELPEARTDDKALEEEIREYLDTVSWPVKDREELEDLVFAGSSYGQHSGFISGFRYALALVFEGLV